MAEKKETAKKPAAKTTATKTTAAKKTTATKTTAAKKPAEKKETTKADKKAEKKEERAIKKDKVVKKVSVVNRAVAPKATKKHYITYREKDRKWVLTVEKGGKATKLFNTKAEAEEYAKGLKDTKVVRQKKDGKFQKDKY